MPKRYLALWLMAILMLVACAPQATPAPFDRFTSTQVIDALNAAGATIQNPVQDMIVGRDAPVTFSERVVFQIPSVAPEGGQVLIFRTAQDLQAWTDYITSLQASADTRRTVIYTYTNQNAMLQLNANLTNAEATRYRDAFLALN
jgi:hypothetical protein